MRKKASKKYLAFLAKNIRLWEDEPYTGPDIPEDIENYPVSREKMIENADFIVKCLL